MTRTVQKVLNEELKTNIGDIYLYLRNRRASLKHANATHTSGKKVINLKPCPTALLSATVDWPIEPLTVISDWFHVPGGTNLPANASEFRTTVQHIACAEARLCFCFHERLCAFSADWLYFTFRRIDPNLLPWGPRRSIAEANPQLKVPNHVLRFRMPLYFYDDLKTSSELPEPHSLHGFNPFVYISCYVHKKIPRCSSPCLQMKKFARLLEYKSSCKLPLGHRRKHSGQNFRHSWDVSQC